MSNCKDCNQPVHHPHFIAIAVDATYLGGGIKTIAVCESCVKANPDFYADLIAPPAAPEPKNEYRAQAGTAEGTGSL